MKKESRNVWSWGFTKGAENWNGRLAMIGFVLVLLTELLTKKSLLSFLGIIEL
uniref:CAB/ELIP/HLIP superfamily protein n=1 Tax=Timspurckia oligopyrenoides TaxID=708627 RepID=UPI001FCD611F|nr:CAB/ELIP/HLIP superfamily protein [Timspurckia oligopyrenoides]UNJ17438.1 CAB/ELIP/HLIP superfamily protein [Timspurckia oligopyrenoides]